MRISADLVLFSEMGGGSWPGPLLVTPEHRLRDQYTAKTNRTTESALRVNNDDFDYARIKADKVRFALQCSQGLPRPVFQPPKVC